MSLVEAHLSPFSDEAALLHELQCRKEGAFEELLNAYQQPIYRFVFRLLDDPSEAPDVTQEVFIKVFRRIRSFRGECSLKTWIYRIAMNEASNRRRWFKRHRRQEVAVDPAQDPEGPQAEPFIDQRATPFDAAYRREQLALIEQALRNLDERLRCAVLLRDIEGLSYNEIAEITRVSIGTVKSRILRGREALKLRLQRLLPAEEGPEPDACAVQAE